MGGADDGPEQNVFAETGEILFWLYAIGNLGVNETRLSLGLRWARDQVHSGRLCSRDA
jgi:hypothetical protein